MTINDIAAPADMSAAEKRLQEEIEQRSKTETALRESEARFRALFENSPDPCWIIDEHNRFTLCNQAAADMLGYESTEKLSSTHPSKLSPEMQPDGRQSYEKADEMMATAHREGVHRFEWVHKRKNGECFPVEVTLARVEIDGREHLYCVWRDISERKQVERSLRESRERLLQAQSVGNVGVWDWDPVSGALVWTEETFRIFGYEPREVQPSYELFLEHVHPDDRGVLVNAVSAALNEGGKYDIDCRFKRRDGSEGAAYAQGEVSFDEAGNPIRMLGTFQDITRRKETEEQLRQALSVQRATFEATADGILVVNQTGEWDAFNQRFIEMWRITPEIMTSGDDKRALDYVLSQLSDPQAFIDKVMDLYSNPEETSFDVLHFRDGRVFERYSTQQRIDDRITGRVWSFRDVTARYRAEDSLRKSEERFALAMAGANDGLWDWDLETNDVYYSPRWFSMLGYTPDGFSRSFETWEKLVHPDDRDRVKSAARDYLDGVKDSFELEMRMKHKDGHDVIVLSRASKVLRESDRRPVRLVGTHVDITERKQLEDQIRQSQKMEAIGTLAGGLAHDFNNLLASMLGNVHLARMQVGDRPGFTLQLSSIEQLVNRGAEMVQRLLTFARKDTVRMAEFSMNDFVVDAMKLTGALVPENIELRTDFSDAPLYVQGDATQLQQVLMNLITNAVDAVSGTIAPKILCGLRETTADDEFMQRHPGFREGQRLACLWVNDNGMGMGADDIAKIFEPFYTTKEVGKGTGLGLSMVYGAVQRHGGVVDVVSRPGQGCDFRVYLPLVAVPSLQTTVESEHEPVESGGRVLLVDDEVELRSTTTEVLSRLGYEMLEAGSGLEALELFREQGSEIDLIISDVIMPGMGGAELIRQIRAIDPSIPVILATGYDKNHVLDQDVPGELVEIVTKPFSFDDLTTIIQALLDQRQ